MNLQWISLAKDIAIIGGILGAGLAMFVFVRFAPNLRLRILPRWVNKAEGFLILKLEVENISRIHFHKEKILLQILEHEVPKNGRLSEWVPFDKGRIKQKEQPKEWHEPIDLFRTTKYINPGETLSIERLCRCPEDSILHIGLQAKAKLGVFGRLAARVRSWEERWASTIIVMCTTKDT